jgi:hypothetical protein
MHLDIAPLRAGSAIAPRNASQLSQALHMAMYFIFRAIYYNILHTPIDARDFFCKRRGVVSTVVVVAVEQHGDRESCSLLWAVVVFVWVWVIINRDVDVIPVAVVGSDSDLC